MRILVVMNGAWMPQAFAHQWLVRGLAVLGHRVIPVDHHLLATIVGVGGAQRLLQAYARAYRPHIIISNPPYDGVSHQTAAVWQALGIPSFGWRYDDTWPQAEMAAVPQAMMRLLCNAQDRFTVVGTTNPEILALLRAQGHANTGLFPLAARPNPGTADAPAAACTFVGSSDTHFTRHTGDRRRILEGIVRAGLPLTIYGRGWEDVPALKPHWQGYAEFEALPAIFRKSTLTLAIDGWHSPSVKTRLFDITLAGGLALAEPSVELDSVFVTGKEVVTAADEAELHERIRYLLGHPAEAAAIAAAGQARARQDHTLEQRWNQIAAALADHLGHPLLDDDNDREVDAEAARPILTATLALAHLLAGRGGPKAARFVLQTCAEIAPTDYGVQAALAKLAESDGDHARAVFHWRHAASRFQAQQHWFVPPAVGFGTDVFTAPVDADPRPAALSRLSIAAVLANDVPAYLASLRELAAFDFHAVLQAAEDMASVNPDLARRILSYLEDEAAANPPFASALAATRRHLGTR